MRRLAALLLLIFGALLLTSSAPGIPVVPGDPTPPDVQPEITGTLGLAGWYVTNTTVRWIVTDPESIILETEGCDTRTLGDTTGTTLRCRALSDGGETIKSKTFTVDQTAPALTPDPEPNPNSNGWHRGALAVRFPGTDATSGIDSCTPDQPYAGPDTDSTPISGFCTDKAGNRTDRTYMVEFDTTPPTLTPDPVPNPNAAGWHRAPLTVKFPGSDATSGIESCTPDQPYSSPDTDNTAILGSCTDRAGNRTERTYTLRYDATPPALVPDPVPDPNALGWHRAPLTIKFPGNDATSGIETCSTDQPYAGGDTSSTPIDGFCTDKAGNRTDRTYTLRYDATAPGLTPNPEPNPNANGWHKAALTVSFPGTDATSGINTCSPARPYNGPDTTSSSIDGFCTDKAGNRTDRTYALKFDATAPSIDGGTPSRVPNANGWYREPLTVTFRGTDPTSGIDSCSEVNYGGPDGVDKSVSGTCRDKADNQSAASAFVLDYDGTAPVLTPEPVPDPNALGWHRAPLTIKFPGTDATSGIASCTPDRPYASGDTPSTPIAGSCTDQAGNHADSTYNLKFDATAPALTPDPEPNANANGWHRAPLTVSFPGTDATSGINTCTSAQQYNGGDTLSTPIPGFCTDKAGNRTDRTYDVHYDATAPALTPDPVPDSNAAGWHRQLPLAIKFPGTDATSGIDACTPDQPYAGGDTASTPIPGFCTDKAGNRTDRTYTLRFDATAPALTPDPVPDPNALGWHNAPLAVKFPGTDATSGIDSCSPDRPYSSPETTGTRIDGSCTDKAGNRTDRTYNLKYDATAPALIPDPVPDPNATGWHRAPLTVRFPGTDAMSGIDACTPDHPYASGDTASTLIDGFCTDKAGNRTDRTYALKFDATAPALTPDPVPDANAAGWHRQKPVTIKFPGTDATSGIDACTRDQAYTGSDTPSTPIPGFCTDKAGNRTDRIYDLKFDATVPALTPDPVPDPNALGWHREPLAIKFPGTDATSGIDSCSAERPYSSPDTTGTPIDGFCTDKAGNRTDRTYTLKYDATAPALTPAASRNPDRNDWYNHALVVRFPGTDATSQIDSCSPDRTYGGPDRSDASVSGSCTDRAGNTTAKAFGFKYDQTGPALVPDPVPDPNALGWHRQPPTVKFPGSDATSLIDTCTPDQPYAGGDTKGIEISGFCTDKAGNRTDASYTVKYDATTPNLEPVRSRNPDESGWYNHELSIRFPGSDATSGVDVCTPEQRYSGPDTGTASVPGACTDRAGNTTTKTVDFKYDDTAPQITPSASRPPDSNGWYNEPLSFTFTGSDATSGLQAACGSSQRYEGPDGVFAIISGTCADNAGNAGFGSMAIKYDTTAPQVTGASADRAPDGNGWFNRPLSVRFQGTDATSDIDSCSVLDYSGPNNLNATVSGYCRDRAGNESAPNPYSFKYDSSPPSLMKLTVKALNRSALLTWVTSTDTALVEIVRTRGANGARVRVYRGTGRNFTDRGLENGVRYRYTLTGLDEANNAATAEAAATPNAPLVSPKAGAVVSAPPRLAWQTVPKATYYNAQVWRNGRIFSAWPKGTSVQLKRTWVYNGRRYRLTPGRYRWYVWPGFGKRAKKDFGRLIGSSSFVVR
jgi:large repetitive protein